MENINVWPFNCEKISKDEKNKPTKINKNSSPTPLFLKILPSLEESPWIFDV